MKNTEAFFLSKEKSTVLDIYFDEFFEPLGFCHVDRSRSYCSICYKFLYGTICSVGSSKLYFPFNEKFFTVK